MFKNHNPFRLMTYFLSPRVVLLFFL